MTVQLREVTEHDIELIAATHGGAAWHGENGKWSRYLSEQQRGLRFVMLAVAATGIVGYGTLKKTSDYPYFRDQAIPEIQDLVVAEGHRGCGVGTQLIRALEARARAGGSSRVGIGFGLYRDYGAAQRLYVRLGYIPDGNGLFYNYAPVEPGTQVKVDDDLVLWLVRELA
jgi:GNAT superfamily N-acetyltransferase